MSSPSRIADSGKFRFDNFEFDSATGELLKSGRKVLLQPQPAHLLRLLLVQAGGLVSREVIQAELWGDATTVDFELGVNRCVRQLRATLLDNSNTPRYIETMPRKGYRFIATVQSPASEATPRLPQSPVRGQEPGYQASIAVLPFANLSGDINDEYFGDGLSEEITNALAQIPELKVIARTSAFAFKGRNEDIRSIGQALGVDHVLEGSVRRAGSRVRVTAQLIQASDGTHLSSKRYDSDMADIFALQDDIAADIAGQFKLRLRAPKRPTANIAAFEAFLEGRFQMYKFTPEGLKRSLGLFERAVAIDPNYARAYTGIAEYHLSSIMDYLTWPQMVLPKAVEAAGKAHALDDQDAEAHAAMGEAVAMLNYDWPKAKRHFDRARQFAFQPHVRMRYALCYLIPQGRLQEAEVEADAVLQHDPMLLVGHTTKAIPLMLGRAYERAAECCLRALEIDARFPYGLYFLVQIRVCQGRFKEARALAAQLLDILGKSHVSLSIRGLVYAAEGDRKAAEGVIGQIESLPEGARICPTGIASIHALLGDASQALEWMNRAIEYRDPRVLWIKTLPWMDSVRLDPRYGTLLEKLNLA
jgi:TolB-like protein